MGFIIFISKFSIAGLSGVIINFITTYILKEKLKINQYISNSCGITTALTINFILNKYWTFQTPQENIVTEIYQYIIIMILSVVMNHLTVYTFTSKLKVNFYVSKVLAVLLVFFWNITMHTIYTFNTEGIDAIEILKRGF